MVLAGLAVMVGALSGQAIPAVPGGCTAPASENIGKPGCYLSAEITIDRPPSVLYWHIVSVATETQARTAARRNLWSTVVAAHDRWWLYVLSPSKDEPALPPHDVAGPLRVEANVQLTARFMESWFPPGMRTRVHRHAGPEAFYVIEGEQCTETPTGRRRIKAGESYIVPSGPHLQAAPLGRRSVVLILAPHGQPWMQLSDDWPGSGFCRI